MRIFILLALCAAPALAQPGKAKSERERPVDLNLQLKQVLQNFALELTLLDPINNDFSLTNTPHKFLGGRAGFFGAEEWAREHAIVFSHSVLSVTDVKILKKTGDSATAQVSYFVTLRNAVGVKDGLRQQWEHPRQEEVRFQHITNQSLTGANPAKKEGHFAFLVNWKIVPPDAPPMPLPTSWATPPQDNIWANIAYYLSQKQQFQPSGIPAERSLQNLKELGLGTSLMATDFDASYAFAPPYVIQALTPFVQNSVAFLVPDTNELYSFNVNLSGLKTDQVKTPARTVLFYEGQNQKPIFRYDGKAAIGFADGHTALVSPDEAQKLIWKP